MGKADDDAHLLIGSALGTTYRRANKTETYVSVPPALVITDSDGGTWTLGFQRVIHNHQFEFNVLRNGVDVGEMAKLIEYTKGVVKIFGHYGWKSFSRSRRHFI
jgi:hypothetical protein